MNFDYSDFHGDLNITLPVGTTWDVYESTGTNLIIKSL